MEEQYSPILLQSLEMRTSRLERRLKFTTYGWLLTVGAVALSAWMRRARAETEQANKYAGILRVRRLVVVDETGVERVVVAAPLPDPQVMGERRHRRSPATGVQINDASGNERGGVVMLDDGSMVVGIDDEKCQERAHLFYIPGRGAGLVIRDDEGNECVVLPDKAQG